MKFAIIIFSILTLFIISIYAKNTKVGVARENITGPIIDISTGYNSIGDTMKGLLTRIYARAFVIDNEEEPFVFVSAEIVHMTESIKPGVLEKLEKDGYPMFKTENVMIAATHCHSSTSNTSWFPLYDYINGVPGYDDESYKIIVKGIAKAIEKAFDSRVDGSISLVYDNTNIKAYNRSADAFLTNKDIEEFGFEVNKNGTFSYETGLKAAKEAYNHEMAGIILTDAKGNDIGFYNFFASHGTSNNIKNRYVASDHKGYASLYLEKELGNGFVAAFAQADSGDTSPNAVNEENYHKAFCRPNELDPNIDVIENQIVHGSMEAQEALRLLKEVPRIQLEDDIVFNYSAVDFSNIIVDLSYVSNFYMPYDDLNSGFVKTSEPCIGAGIIAGDEEGAPVSNAQEGSVKHKYIYNSITGHYDVEKYNFSTIALGGLEKLMGKLWPLAMKILNSDSYDDEQMEKVVCLAVGSLMQKVQPLQIVKIGQVAIVGVPFEVTYAQAERIRKVLLNTMASSGVTKIIIATHANSYSQYITTREEYAAQHYEGSSCLFGPWSGAALTQELDKLAQGIIKGSKSTHIETMLQKEPKGLLYTSMAAVNPSIDVGIYCKLKKDVEKTLYHYGEWVNAIFSGSNPRHICYLTLDDNPIVPEDYTYFEIQRLVDGNWQTFLTDNNPYTTFYVRRAAIGFDITTSWLIKGDTYKNGTYRFVYNGIAKEGIIKTKYRLIKAYSSNFNVE